MSGLSAEVGVSIVDDEAGVEIATSALKIPILAAADGEGMRAAVAVAFVESLDAEALGQVLTARDFTTSPPDAVLAWLAGCARQWSETTG